MSAEFRRHQQDTPVGVTMGDELSMDELNRRYVESPGGLLDDKQRGLVGELPAHDDLLQVAAR